MLIDNILAPSQKAVGSSLTPEMRAFYSIRRCYIFSKMPFWKKEEKGTNIERTLKIDTILWGNAGVARV